MAEANLVLPQHYPPQFQTNWKHRLQQHASRLRQCVHVKTGVTGKAHSCDQLDPIEFSEITARMAKTDLPELETKRRWTRPRKFDAVRGFDEWDDALLGQIVSPTGATIQAMDKGAGRKLDDILIEGMTGTNYTGEEGVDAVTLPSTQTMAVNTTYASPGGTGSNTGLTLWKLIYFKHKMGVNEAYGQDVENMGQGGPGSLWLAVTQAQLTDLLADVDQVSNKDYAAVQALVYGEVNHFMGIHFKRTERLSKASNIRTCVGWTYEGVELDIWADVTSRMSIRDDRNEALQVRSKFMAGCTRLQEECVVTIPCEENASL